MNKGVKPMVGNPPSTERVRPSMGSQHLSYHLRPDQGLLPVSRLNKVSLHREWINTDSTGSGPTNCLSHTTVANIQRAYFSPIRLLSCQSRVNELLLAQVGCLCGFPQHDLDPFARIIAPLSLQLYSQSLAQCLAVDLCIYFHQLLDEGSMMTIKVVINCFQGKGS